MRYRKVSVRLWRDARFRALSEDAQFVWLALLTGPDTTSVGIIPRYVDSLAPEIGRPANRVGVALDELAAAGMVEIDHDAGVIVMPGWFKHNPPENPSVITGMRKTFEDMPDSVLVDTQQARFRECIKSLPTRSKHRADTVPTPCRLPEPDPEPEQEPDPDPRADTDPRARDALRSEFGVGECTPNQERRELTDRVVAVTGEEHLRSWWSDVIRGMQPHDGAVDDFTSRVRYAEECADPEIRKRKDLGVLKRPGGYLHDQAQRVYQQHHLRMPAVPKKAVAQ